MMKNNKIKYLIIFIFSLILSVPLAYLCVANIYNLIVWNFEKTINNILSNIICFPCVLGGIFQDTAKNPISIPITVVMNFIFISLSILIFYFIIKKRNYAM